MPNDDALLERSACPMRALRLTEDADLFWFRDDLHQPLPISPMGLTTIQKHHSWGFHWASDACSFPASRGAHVKASHGRIYLGFQGIQDLDVRAARGTAFEKFLEERRADWADFYDRNILEVTTGLAALQAARTDARGAADMLRLARLAERTNRRNWEIHFFLMYPATTLLFEFEERYGTLLSEHEQLALLTGTNSIPIQTERSLWELAARATRNGLGPLLDGPLDSVADSEEGRRWQSAFRAFLDRFGYRLNAGHLDVTSRTWIEDPSAPLALVRSYARMLADGQQTLPGAEAVADRARSVRAEALERMAPDRRHSFLRDLELARSVYCFQEDHGFYIDMGSTAHLRLCLLDAGRLLCRKGLLATPEDVMLLAFHELCEVLDGIARHEHVAKYHYGRLLPGLIGERRAIIDDESAQVPPLCVGTIPDDIQDPVAIKIFGLRNDVIRAALDGAQENSSVLRGMPASAGTFEGEATVVSGQENFALVEPGSLVVCEATSTTWTPLFPKIRGIVTETGGMLAHAAIAAREYGIPAVVGVWNATAHIDTGDIVRIDGEQGTVELVRRAADKTP